MTGIMVLGHGHFASGIASAAELILGKQDDFVWVDFPEGDTKTELEAHIAEEQEVQYDALMFRKTECMTHDMGYTLRLSFM